jgi:hypothetical protein
MSTAPLADGDEVTDRPQRPVVVVVAGPLRSGLGCVCAGGCREAGGRSEDRYRVVVAGRTDRCARLGW